MNNDENVMIPYLVLEKYIKEKYMKDFSVIYNYINFISSFFKVKRNKISMCYSTDKSEKKITCIQFEVPQNNISNKHNHYVYTFENGKNSSQLWLEDYNEYSFKVALFDPISPIFINHPKTMTFNNYIFKKYNYLPANYFEILTSDQELYLNIKVITFEKIVFDLSTYFEKVMYQITINYIVGEENENSSS